MASLLDRFRTSKAAVVRTWNAFAFREKMLIVGGSAVIIVIALSEIIQPVMDSLAEQNTTLTSAQQKLDITLLEIAKYEKLKTRHADIESAFKHVEMKEFMLSYLEHLVRDTAGISTGFTIKDKPVKPFGGKYEQVPYSVKFTTNDMGKLIAFLTELEQGEHPLILASIDLKRKQNNDGLNVELEVSSLRESGKNSEET